MKQLFFSSLIIFAFSTKISAQEKTCLVSLEAINGVYTGDCDKGKANGKGKSIGTDQYDGEFKDGYPDGKGTYTWKDGHYFIGNYKKGKKEGKGDMYYEGAGGADSVVTGFWKKDKYIGEYEKQYVVIAYSGRVNKVECSLTDKKGQDIFITIHRKSGGGAVQTGSTATPVVNDVQHVSGTFYTRSNQVMTNSSMTRIQQVVFPFRAIFTFSNGESAEILFNEKGNYDVYVDLQ